MRKEELYSFKTTAKKKRKLLTLYNTVSPAYNVQRNGGHDQEFGGEATRAMVIDRGQRRVTGGSICPVVTLGMRDNERHDML